MPSDWFQEKEDPHWDGTIKFDGVEKYSEQSHEKGLTFFERLIYLTLPGLLHKQNGLEPARVTIEIRSHQPHQSDALPETS